MAENGQKPFQWAFIGTGTLAHSVAREICASGRHSIAAAFSRRAEKVAEFTGLYGGKPCTDAEEAIKSADAVYVVTPHPSHFEYVKLAIELGKPVLCEKPFTVKASETRELFDLAREKGVYIVEGMWTWFCPVAREVKAWLDSGALGDIQQVVTNYRVNVLSYAPRLTDPVLAGGALLDSGVYPITYLYRLFGKPTGVRCTGLIKDGVDLSDDIYLSFPDGRTDHIALSICDDERVEDIRLIGSKGEIYADNFHYANKAELRDKSGQVLETIDSPTTLLKEFDLVAEEIRAGRKESAYIPPRATLEVMEILDECRRQIGLVYPFEV